jgi:hypothetical protein
LVHLKGYSEKIDDPNKVVEIDESKFGRRKYHTSHAVKMQTVFGGVERKSGKPLGSVPDTNADIN